MYHLIGIDKLSSSQHSRLRNGHRVRVRHGNHHKIHVSKEQHKKIMAAHKKGKSYTIQFDPYQMDMHKLHHKKGKGIFDTLKKISSPIAHKIVDAGVDYAGNQAKDYINHKLTGSGIRRRKHKTRKIHKTKTKKVHKKKIHRTKKGKGILGDLGKIALKKLAPIALDSLMGGALNPAGY
jgi:hypothetical protein